MSKNVKEALNTLKAFDISLDDISAELHMPISKLKVWLKGPNDKKRFALVSGAIMKIVKNRQRRNF